MYCPFKKGKQIPEAFAPVTIEEGEGLLGFKKKCRERKEREVEMVTSVCVTITFANLKRNRKYLCESFKTRTFVESLKQQTDEEPLKAKNLCGASKSKEPVWSF